MPTFKPMHAWAVSILAVVSFPADSFGRTPEYDLTFLSIRGGNESQPCSLNDLDEVPGTAPSLDGNGCALLHVAGAVRDRRTIGGTMSDLNDAVINGGAGWVLGEARDIDSPGRIGGMGKFTGTTRALPPAPVPVPDATTLTLLTLGTMLLMGQRVRRRRPGRIDAQVRSLTHPARSSL